MNDDLPTDLTPEALLVLADHQDEDGSLWRAITIEDDAFVLSGHDVGPGVERVLGCREYEFERRLTAEETARLRTLLGVAGAQPLLDAVAARFDAIEELEAYLAEHEIEGIFWSQLGE